MFCITGALIYASVLVIAHSLTFYFGNAVYIANTMEEFLLSFSIYPEGIFKGLTLFIIYTAVPAAFVTYIPVNIIREFSIIRFLVLVAFTLVYLTLAFVVFEKGLKRYELGNLINARM